MWDNKGCILCCSIMCRRYISAHSLTHCCVFVTNETDVDKYVNKRITMIVPSSR